eukprot:m.196534 g.196534  ORF g.196534 m.196534 type:complete len:223 (-) comp32621_c0_seq3:660-1328(-)
MSDNETDHEVGSLIVKGLIATVFTDSDEEGQLRAVLEQYGKINEIELVAEMGAVKLRYTTNLAAVDAEHALNFSDFLGQTIYAKSFTTLDLLAVPELEKQWLISPPPSPPVGWVSRKEDPPVVNHALVAAIQDMDTTIPRVVLAAQGRRPSICVVDVLNEDEIDNTTKSGRKLSFISMPPKWNGNEKKTHGAPWQSKKDGPTTIATKMPPRTSSPPKSIPAS